MKARQTSEPGNRQMENIGTRGDSDGKHSDSGTLGWEHWDEGTYRI